MSLSSEYEGKRQRFKDALQRLYNILSQEKMQYDDVAKGILESIFADLNMDDGGVKKNVQMFEALFVTPFGITTEARQAFAKSFFKGLTKHVKMQLYEINRESIEQRLCAALQAETPKRPKDDEPASAAKRVAAAPSSAAAAASSSAAAAAAASSSAAAAASSSAAAAASSSAAASRRRRRLSSDSSLD